MFNLTLTSGKMANRLECRECRRVAREVRAAEIQSRGEELRSFTCVVCGAEGSQVKGSNRIYCDAHKKSIRRTCRTCGEYFLTQGGRYCSDECRPVGHKVFDHAGRDADRLWAAAVGHPFTKSEVFERDHWKCRLCGEKVDRDLRYPDPGSASVDHIIPTAWGGLHTWVNVQLTHLKCNLKKNAREPVQLSLLG